MGSRERLTKALGGRYQIKRGIGSSTGGVQKERTNTIRSLFSRSRAWAALPVILASLLFGCGKGFTPEELAEATAQVREAYYAQDHYFGVELGVKWVSRAAEALELRAWTVANLMALRLDGGEARGMAEEMVATHPESPWSWFALARVTPWEYPRGNEEEAMNAAARAAAGLPGNPDPPILQARILQRYEDRDAALAFLDELDEPLRSHLDIRAFRVFNLAPPANRRTAADTEVIIKTYEDILAADPNHVLANYGLGRFLMGMEGEEQKARPYLEQAAALSPSALIHSRLWRHTVEDPNLDAAERLTRVTQGLSLVMDSCPESPGRWIELARDLRFLGFTELQEELEERALSEHPDSWAAERVLAARISSLAFEWRNTRPDSQEGTSQESRRLKEAVDEFLARAQHRDPAAVQEAYWNLFLLEKERPAPDLDRLSELAEAWAGYRSQVRDIWADQLALNAAISLGLNSQTLEAAKHLLAAGREEMDKFLQERELQSEDFSASVFDAQEFHIRSSQAHLSIASSLVLAREGSFEEAEATLGHALDYGPEERDAQRVLPLADLAAGTIKELQAKFAGKNGDPATAERFLASAEEFYLNGLRRDYDPSLSFGFGWINPNEAALEDLFERRNGSLNGFGEYLASAKEGGLDARRTEILASRIEDPQPIPSFALEDLTGDGVTSESYLGKVVIINFWGTW